MSETFDASRFERLIRERGIELGLPLSYRPVTESTNDDALSAARAGAPHGACFVADDQTRGRGRRGHEWLAPAGLDLTFSLLLRPELEPRGASPLTLVVGLAVREAAQRHLRDAVSLKWPNDLFVQDRKLGGILLESQLHQNRLSGVVAGVGLNVGSRVFAPPLDRTATSFALLGADVPREVLLADVCDALAPRLREFTAAGLGGFLPELERWDWLRGRAIRVDGRSGIASGIDADGALLLSADGQLTRVLAGSVEFQ